MIAWLDVFVIATLVFLFLVVTGRAVYLRAVHHINPIKIGTGRSGLHKSLEFCLTFGLALWMVTVLSCALHVEGRIFPTFIDGVLLDSIFAKLAGLVLLVCSLVIFVLALVSLGRSWRIGIDNKQPGDLVSDGIFALSRNPIYLSLVLHAVGAFLIYGRPILLVSAILVAVGVHYQILQEEKFLRSNYGQAYESYCARTARYITF